MTATMKRSLAFSQELLTNALLDEAMPLLQAHWREIAHYQDIPLRPNREVYLAAEAAGTVRTYCARTPEGRLVGYAVFFLAYNPHYMDSYQAAQDIIYLDPACRGRGLQFLNWCDRQLQSEGVQVVRHHIKAAHNFGPALERLGYTLEDLIYSRRLDTGG